MLFSRLLLILLLVTCLLKGPAVAAEQFVPKYIDDASEVCVERQENDGVLNIVPVTVIVSVTSKVTLLGGQAGCLFVPTGKQTIQLSFPYPYSGPSAPPAWTTQERTLDLKKTRTVAFELCPAPNQNVNDASWIKVGWHSMWLLEEGKGAAQCAPK